MSSKGKNTVKREKREKQNNILIKWLFAWNFYKSIGEIEWQKRKKIISHIFYWYCIFILPILSVQPTMFRSKFVTTHANIVYYEMTITWQDTTRSETHTQRGQNEILFSIWSATKKKSYKFTTNEFLELKCINRQPKNREVNRNHNLNYVSLIQILWFASKNGKFPRKSLIKFFVSLSTHTKNKPFKTDLLF